MKEKAPIVVTSALPYANDDIHIGHLVEYLQTDFWVRFQKLRGEDCLYFCADDTHGTPVMISAKKAGISPEELIKQNHERHYRDFQDFQVEFDNYASTNIEENRLLCEEIYQALKDKGHTATRTIKQLYCENDNMFLPDRFVKGSCPNCGAADQYGDSCDSCSATYSPADMKDAACSICGSTPVTRDSEHIFVKLNDFRDYLRKWVPEHVSSDIANKLDEWLKEDLRDWDISRDAPYFGFKIPGYKDKYFYVWVDAPIGYAASTWQWCKKNGRDFNSLWRSPDTRLYHFIGKDIVYFHTLFWPAMLDNAGFKTPDGVFVHGFLTVNGVKMSKSKGTFIKARTYLDQLDPMYLRYYYACKMSCGSEDIDLNFDDFIQRVNSDLIGKITNLASRGAQMLGKNFDHRLGKVPADADILVKAAQDASEQIASHYHERNFHKAMIEIRSLADEANRYFDEKKPWELVKQDRDATLGVLTAILNVFRIISIYLKPVLPRYTEAVEKLFSEQPYDWTAAATLVEEREIGTYSHLAARIDKKAIEAIVADSTQAAAVSKAEASAGYEKLAPEIDIDTFFKPDLRIAKIIEAEDIKEAGKLLRLKVDIGFEQRTIIAGIKQAYKPEELVGRLTVIAANLKPRKMKFGTSEGMVLAAGEGGSDLFILSPDSGAKPGQRVS